MTDLLKMFGITKQFGDYKANDHVSIDVREGEILALLGENGAGKTTLMNLLYGLYRPTEGEIWFEGQKVTIESPIKAISLGIGMVHQHFMLVNAFKTWENIVLGAEAEKGVLHEKEAVARIRQLAADYNLQLDPYAKISSLSVGLQQQVEIAKVLYRGCKLLIMDEPTGVLTPIEKEKLFKTMRDLAKKGLSVIFISHKLDEVLEISDRVTVLCRGKNICTVSTNEVSKRDLARMMVGRDVVLTVERERKVLSKEIVLSLDNVCAEGNRLASCLKNLSMEIHKGEVFGIAGVDGNGQSELAEVVSGLRKIDSGTLKVAGENVTNLSPGALIKKGVALVPEDRKTVGTVHSFTIDRNMILRNTSGSKYVRRGVIDYKRLKLDTEETIRRFDIRFAGREDPVGHMSGGNLQKVVLARELNSSPRLLVAMHPTRGLDVGAIEYIHKKILEAAESGVSVLLISTELEEILSLSDTVSVISGGKLSKKLSGSSLTMENIGLLMGGSKITEEDGYEK